MSRRSWRRPGYVVVGLKRWMTLDEMCRLVQGARDYYQRWDDDHELFVCGCPIPKTVGQIVVALTIDGVGAWRLERALRAWEDGHAGRRVRLKDRLAAQFLNRIWARKLGVTPVELREVRQSFRMWAPQLGSWEARTITASDVEMLLPDLADELVSYTEFVY